VFCAYKFDLQTFSVDLLLLFAVPVFVPHKLIRLAPEARSSFSLLLSFPFARITESAIYNGARMKNM
jgi:hypothetical protein